MMAAAIDKGSLEGVQKVHAQFPEVLKSMEHQQLMDVVEYADSLEHHHISDFIASQVARK